jgi:hypothetical protein
MSFTKSYYNELRGKSLPSRFSACDRGTGRANANSGAGRSIACLRATAVDDGAVQSTASLYPARAVSETLPRLPLIGFVGALQVEWKQGVHYHALPPLARCSFLRRTVHDERAKKSPITKVCEPEDLGSVGASPR